MHDPFGRTTIPPALREELDAERTAARTEAAEREQFAQWFAEVASGLLSGTPMSLEARLYVGGAHKAWLDDGARGDLVRDYLHLRPVRGSHQTAAALLRRLREQDPPSSR